MDLVEALRTTAAVREFAPDPVPDETVARLLDIARFAPSGGNRQAWRVIVLSDPARRRGLRDIYLKGWYQYLAMGAAGLVPWAPVTDREAEKAAVASAPALAQAAAAGPGGFAEHLDQVPVLLVLLADLRALAAVDRDLDRYTFVGGASVYPFAWSILLAARTLGLAGVMTTVATRYEDDVRALLGVPDELAVAAVLTLGHPAQPPPTKLRRTPVSRFAYLDRFDGPPLPDPPAGP
jgi:nitroreductase